MRKFLLHEPKTNLQEIKNVSKCLQTGWLSPSGNYVKTFEKNLSNYTNSDLVLTNSGTSALHISLILAGVKNNDEVVVPTMTFIATVNTILYRNAHPIFVDCQKDNPNVDLEKIILFIKDKTFFKNRRSYNKKTKRKIKAVILTHVFGNSSLENESNYLISLMQYDYLSSTDKHYAFTDHTQANPSTIWTINHGLNKFPSVTVVDSAGTQVLGDVQHIDNDNLTITFVNQFSGKAYLN